MRFYCCSPEASGVWIVSKRSSCKAQAFCDTDTCSRTAAYLIQVHSRFMYKKRGKRQSYSHQQGKQTQMKQMQIKRRCKASFCLHLHFSASCLRLLSNELWTLYISVNTCNSIVCRSCLNWKPNHADMLLHAIEGRVGGIGVSLRERCVGTQRSPVRILWRRLKILPHSCVREYFCLHIVLFYVLSSTPTRIPARI